MSKIKEVAKLEAEQRKKKLAEQASGKQQSQTTPVKRRSAQSSYLGALAPTGPNRRTLPTGAGEGAVVHANPEKCRPWKYHDRSIELIDQASVDELAALISEHGQKMPALGRYVNGKDDSDGIEVIYGVRRWLAVKQLGKSLIIEIRSISDSQALIDMEMENRRLDLSVWERGRSYARWLKISSFTGARDLATELKVDHSVISKAIKIGSLPDGLVHSLGSLNVLTYRYGAKLFTAWSALSSKQQEEILVELDKKQAALSPEELISVVSKHHDAKETVAIVQPKVISVKEGKEKVVISLPNNPEHRAIIQQIKELLAKLQK